MSCKNCNDSDQKNLTKEEVLEQEKKVLNDINTLITCSWERYTETIEIMFDSTKYKSPSEAQILLNQSTILSMLSYLLQKNN